MDMGDCSLKPLKRISSGGFGTTYQCLTQDNKYVCVKRLQMGNSKNLRIIQEELHIFKQLKHPNIVQFHRFYIYADTVNIVMEYLPNGTLRSQLHQRLSQKCLKSYFLDILMGLEYLHIRHVIHRDLKPENLLLDSQNRIKIADFGISVIKSTHLENSCGGGTLSYMAPEVINGGKCDFKSDIWALGCILYEMCTGYTPFREALDFEDMKYLTYKKTTPQLNCDGIAFRYGSVWSQLCAKMIKYDPLKRPALPEIITYHNIITIPFYFKYFEYDYYK
ncbi:aurora kinase A [Teleopsis dalmanni]|uniref:aurora kinase A n=1 Tax=Teleopsis dalmanni TaxID=139649 RepID=UPI0018CD66EE|nr:aurora kinase A [Teleopsis dalmanni]